MRTKYEASQLDPIQFSYSPVFLLSLSVVFSSASCSPTLSVVFAEGERTSFRCVQNYTVNDSCLILQLVIFWSLLFGLHGGGGKI